MTKERKLVIDAIRHLKNSDRILSTIIRDVEPYKVYRRNNSFESLVRIIVGQQLSSKAAATIFQHLKEAMGNQTITTDRISTINDEALFNVGVSKAKTKTIRELTHQIEDGSIRLRRLSNMSDERITEVLTQVKGIGPWSTQMYLMFVLHRPDVFPSTDKGIINAIKKLYGDEYCGEDEIDLITDRWRPFRTIACWYLWKYVDSRA
ncbi:MAG: DNA-3-methyladenine glycosylase 2 family protein [Candidatus Zixiibacteriota bacterium]